MSSSEEDDEFDMDQLDTMRKIMDEKRNNPHNRFQVSGWDDDTEGIEEEKDPHSKDFYVFYYKVLKTCFSID